MFKKAQQKLPMAINEFSIFVVLVHKNEDLWYLIISSIKIILK